MINSNWLARPVILVAWTAGVLLGFTTISSAETVAGFAKGYVHPPYGASGIPLLDSFYFRYSDTDHHIQDLAVYPEQGGQILLAFADKNDDDTYFYSIEHKRYSLAGGVITGSFVDFCNGKCLYPLDPPGPDYIFTLRGFRFYFRNGDHQINEVGILWEGAGVKTYFNDRNYDDPYVVYVDYAWLPASLVKETGDISGTEAGGSQNMLANSNRAIITGFKFDYLGDDVDHEIQDIGIQTRDSDMQVFFGDKNQDDDFSYLVNYAILAGRIVRPFPLPESPLPPIKAAN